MRKSPVLAPIVIALCACAELPPAAADRIASGDTPADAAARVEHMRGCWIARRGSDAVFLRLLTPEPGADVIVSGGEPGAAFTFMRDGSTAAAAINNGETKSYVAATPDWGPKGSTWLVYRQADDPLQFLVIEAPGETLRIMHGRSTGAGPAALSPVFEGERDGCD